MADANRTAMRANPTAIRLAQRLDEVKMELKDWRTSIKEAGSAINMTATDAAGAALGLTFKAGIEMLTDLAKKVKTPQGQFRQPQILSGAISMGTGALAYLGNIAAPYDFPLHWYRELPKAGSMALGVLGAKEFGQAVVVWLEKRQIEALKKMVEAQQSQLGGSQQA